MKEGQVRGLGKSTGKPDFPSRQRTVSPGMHGSLGSCPTAWNLQRQVQWPPGWPNGATPWHSHPRVLLPHPGRSSDLSLLRQGHKSTRLFSICWVTLALGAARCPPAALQGGPRGTHSPARDLQMAPPGPKTAAWPTISPETLSPNPPAQLLLDS